MRDAVAFAGQVLLLVGVIVGVILLAEARHAPPAVQGRAVLGVIVAYGVVFAWRAGRHERAVWRAALAHVRAPGGAAFVCGFAVGAAPATPGGVIARVGGELRVFTLARGAPPALQLTLPVRGVRIDPGRVRTALARTSEGLVVTGPEGVDGSVILRLVIYPDTPGPLPRPLRGAHLRSVAQQLTAQD